MTRRLLITFSILIVLSGIVGYIYVYSQNNTVQTDNTTIVEISLPKKITVVEFLVPVSSYSLLQNELLTEQLKDFNLCALNKSEAIVNSLLSDLSIKFIDRDEVEAELQSGTICLLPPEEIDYKFKSLAIDGYYFWDNSIKLTEYPLQLTSEVFEDDLDNEQLEQVNHLAEDQYRSQIFVSGEIIPARAVDRLALNKNNNYTYLFDYFKEDISQADLAIALLENPINGNPSPCTGCMSFVGDDQNAAGLSEVGYDILSLAGNHAGDGGQSGFKNTIEILNENNIQTTGAGNSDTDKIKPAIYTMNGHRIGVISADTVAGYYWNKGSNYYGTNWFSKDMNANVDYDRVELLPEIKDENNIEYLIIYMSWGVEYTNKANNFQVELAHALIDNGADMIVSSHPHWVQNIEIYKEKPIFYALGNFIFDQNHTDATREGININLYFVDLDLKGIEIMPHLTCGPFISTNNLTTKYLAGDIDKDYLDSHDEKNGCVYFQPRKIEYSNSHYRDIWNRLMQHSDILK